MRLVFNTAFRMVYPYLPRFAEGLGVNLQMMAKALSLRALAGGFGPFLATIADSHGRKTGMLLGTSLAALGLGLVAIQSNFFTFTLALILLTVGYNVFNPSMQAYLGDRTPYSKRGLIMALIETAWSLSFILGVPLMGFLIARGGWLRPFPFLAAFSLAGLVLLGRALPNYHSSDQDGLSLLKHFRSLLGHPPALAGLAMGLCYTSANEMINVIFGIWMEDTFAVSITALGLASLVIGFSELSGETLVGGLADRLGKVRSVKIGLILSCLAALAMPVFGHSLTGALVGLFLFYLTFEFTLVSAIPLMSEVLPSARATTMAANLASHSLGRAIGAPLAVWIYSLDWTPGISLNVLAAVVFNLMALAALSRLKTASDELQR